MVNGVLNTPLTSLGCVSYLAISMIVAALASCDEVIFEISLYVLFNMSVSALSNLKQNLQKSDILGKLMKLHA